MPSNSDLGGVRSRAIHAVEWAWGVVAAGSSPTLPYNVFQLYEDGLEAVYSDFYHWRILGIGLNNIEAVNLAFHCELLSF